MEIALKDIITLLRKEERPDVQILTLDNVLAVTGTEDGVNLILHQPALIEVLVAFLENVNKTIKRTSALILINISAHEMGATALLDTKISIVDVVITNIANINSEIADPCCMILSNIVRPNSLVETVASRIKDLEQILDILTKVKYNMKGHNLFYLGVVLSNLSQYATVRKYILDKSKHVVQRLLPFTEFKDSTVKRGGIVGTLRNCCFEVEYHSWLLSEDVDILPRLLLPLTGNTEFSEEDNEKLPCELQYLPSDKEREEDPDIRCMLLESITQLCTLRVNREYVRNQNTYVILRELHKWEKDKKALLACENLVDILIRTEDEIGKDNLKDADVPNDLVEKFEQMDRDFLNS